MATVNKDFKVKNGLIVEGTTAKVNNYDILTKKPDDQTYIIGLIGGTATPDNTVDTVVKRDGTGSFSAQTVTVESLNVSGIGTISDDGELLIAASVGEDIKLTADDIRMESVDDIRMTAQGDILLDASEPGMGVYVGSISTGNTVVTEAIMDTHIGDNTVDGTAGNTVYDRIFNAKSEAIADAGTATDLKLADYTTTANLDTTIDGYGYLKSADLTGYATESYADQAEADAITTANAYTDGRETAITSAYEAYSDQSEVDAKAYTDTRETAITTAYQSYADTAEQDAKDYADNLINDASNLSTEVWSAYKTSTEIGLAQAAAEQHADDAVAALVDSAPAMLDTLNELAAALQDNPDVITDLQDLAAGKQNTLTAGSNIDITLDVISVTGLDAADISDFNTAAVTANTGLWDTLGAAATAESNANSYTDGRETAITTAYQSYADQAEADALADANTYTDGEITTALSTAQGYANTAEQNAKDYADALDTDDVAEGLTNLYFTNQRAIDAVGGTIGDAIDLLDTDDIEEGTTNLYFTSSRAKSSAAELLTGATLTNITITGDGSGLTITAENGVADSTTSDLAEGSNLYFTDARAVDALEAVVPNFTEVDINSLATQVASTTSVATASQVSVYSFAKADYRSAEFLVKTAYGTHTEISKVLLTLDTSDNIAITEYGTIGTNGSSMSISADIDGSNVRLLVTTINNNSVVNVVGTLLA